VGCQNCGVPKLGSAANRANSPRDRSFETLHAPLAVAPTVWVPETEFGFPANLADPNSGRVFAPHGLPRDYPEPSFRHPHLADVSARDPRSALPITRSAYARKVNHL
jgi:hypothetical protein